MWRWTTASTRFTKVKMFPVLSLGSFLAFFLAFFFALFAAAAAAAGFAPAFAAGCVFLNSQVRDMVAIVRAIIAICYGKVMITATVAVRTVGQMQNNIFVITDHECTLMHMIVMNNLLADSRLKFIASYTCLSGLGASMLSTAIGMLLQFFEVSPLRNVSLYSNVAAPRRIL